MKRIKYLFLALLSVFVCLFASGCMRSTKPADYTWYLQSYTFSSFNRLADGAQISRTYTVGYPSIYNPLSAAYTKQAEISFISDNKITLKRYTGETVQGTYETVKPKIQSEVFIATFDGGLKAHMIVAGGYKLYPTLHVDIFDENGNLESYLFTSNHQGQYSKEEIDKSVQDILSAVVNEHSGVDTTTIIERGSVSQKDGKFYLTQESNGEIYDLSLATKGLYALAVSDNALRALSALQTGVCYYATNHIPSQHGTQTYEMAIYYFA